MEERRAHERIDALDATLIYGFYRDFSVVLEQAEWSVCNIEIEGLT